MYKDHKRAANMNGRSLILIGIPDSPSVSADSSRQNELSREAPFSLVRPRSVGRRLGSYTSANNVRGTRNPHRSAASRAIDSQEATTSLEHLVQTQVVYGSADHQ